MAAAAKQAGVQHVIWSTLEDTRRWMALDDDRMPTIMGKYKVPHFDGKGEANHLFIDAGVPTTFLLTSFYWDNLIHFGMGPRRGEDGRLAITFPMDDKKLPGIAVEDIGRSAYRIFKRGGEFIGRTVGIAGEHLTCGDMAAGLTRALGEAGSLQCRFACNLPRASAFRARPISPTCSSSSGISRRCSAVPAMSRFPTPQSIAADVRAVARPAQSADPRVTRASARRPGTTGIWIDSFPLSNRRRISLDSPSARH